MSDVLRDRPDELEGWFARIQGEYGPGGFPCNSASSALESFRVVKSGAGTLYGFSGFSNRASQQFIQVFDLGNLPADGAVPMIVITVPASSNFSYDGGLHGRAFRAGIVICNSSTAATKTIGSADCWFDAQYV